MLKNIDLTLQLVLILAGAADYSKTFGRHLFPFSVFLNVWQLASAIAHLFSRQYRGALPRMLYLGGAVVLPVLTAVSCFAANTGLGATLAWLIGLLALRSWLALAAVYLFVTISEVSALRPFSGTHRSSTAINK
jgi:hypothetical protein